MTVILSGGGGGTPYDGPYGEGSARKGNLSWASCNERVGITLVEVFEKVGKSVISACKRPKRATEKYYCCEVKKIFCFCDLFIFKRQCIYSS